MSKRGSDYMTDHSVHGGSPSVAVVVPCHKATMDTYERVSFLRCSRVLARHQRILTVPEGLDTRAFVADDPDIEVERFDTEYFASSIGYNLLCRRAEFYERFLRFDYILIYQLDCYVFADELASWCRSGYDYIGAPWPNYEFQLQSRKRWTKLAILRPFLRRVGNGGLSLRRVKTFRRASRVLSPLVSVTQGLLEDVFWCNLGRYFYPIAIPRMDVAVRFAFDASPEVCLSINGGRLPFGCHAWSTSNLAFWQSRITELGASTSGVSDSSVDGRTDAPQA